MIRSLSFASSFCRRPNHQSFVENLEDIEFLSETVGHSVATELEKMHMELKSASQSFDDSQAAQQQMFAEVQAQMQEKGEEISQASPI